MADVNDMGIFSALATVLKIKILNTLDEVMQQSLAVPTKIVVKAINDRGKVAKERFDFIPVLPLIMVGDDLYSNTRSGH